MNQTWSITQMKVPDLDKWMRNKLMQLLGSGEEYTIYLHQEARNKLRERSTELKPETLKLMIGLKLEMPLRFVLNAMNTEVMRLLCQTDAGVRVVGQVKDEYEQWKMGVNSNTFGRAPAAKVLASLVDTIVPMVYKNTPENQFAVEEFMSTYYECTMEAFKYAPDMRGASKAALEHRKCPPATMIACLNAFPELAVKESPLMFSKYIQERKILLAKGEKHAHTMVAEAHGTDKAEPIPVEAPA